MTQLLTAAEMRAVEAAAIASGAVTGAELMARAGRGVVEAVLAEWPDLAGAAQGGGPGDEYLEKDERAGAPRVAVLCGPGNNGGDGFVIARLLHLRGWSVHVLAMPTAATAPDAVSARAAWAALGPVAPLTKAALRAVPDCDLYVDAVFGTGLTRPPRGEIADLLRDLAGSGGDHGFFQPRLVAVDVPSGLCADSGKVLGSPEPDPFNANAPFAQLTVTFETPKPGHFLADGPALCGRLVVHDIGLEAYRCYESPEPRGALRPVALQLVPPLHNGPPEPHVRHRPTPMPKPQGHKYAHGHVVVLTGGLGRTGAARLAARGALRTGAGLVTLGAPPSALMEIATQITALMLRRVETADDLAKLLDDARLDVLCLGPGLGLGAREAALLEVALALAPPKRDRRLVLDADALTLLAQREAGFDGLGAHVVLTPHMGEFRRLFPDIADKLTRPAPPPFLSDADASQEAWAAHDAARKAYRHAVDTEAGPAFSKVDAVRAAAARCGAVVLLKGADTVVADPLGRAWIHAAVYDRAAPWLATAGSGDVLAGIIAGLMARGYATQDAAILGAWLHVEAARAFGPGLIAEDLPEMLPQVFRSMGV